MSARPGVGTGDSVWSEPVAPPWFGKGEREDPPVSSRETEEVGLDPSCTLPDPSSDTGTVSLFPYSTLVSEHLPNSYWTGKELSVE